MAKAARLLDINRLPCLAHKIQSLIMDDMFEHRLMVTLRRVCKKMRIIQKTLLYSHKMLSKIADEQFQKEYVKWLSESNETGWCYYYYSEFNLNSFPFIFRRNGINCRRKFQQFY